MTPAPKRFLFSVFLFSGALLAYEVLIIRLVSILFYPVAAYLVISLALLGLGVGGVALAIRNPKLPITRSLASKGASIFAIASLVSLFVAWFAYKLPQPIPILLPALAVPFVFGGWTMTVALALPGASVNRIYFADLLGASMGGAGVFLGLMLISAPQVMVILSAVGLVASFFFAEKAHPRLIGASLVTLLLLSYFLNRLPYGLVPISPKELALANRLDTSYVWEFQGWNPIARIDVISIPSGCAELPGTPPCKLVTQDGGAPSVLLGLPASLARANLFEDSIFGLPYWIKGSPDVLVIGLGGGPDIQAALLSGAKQVTGVEINQQMVALVEELYGQFTGSPYKDARVKLVIGDGRNFVRQSGRKYDLIQLTGVDSSVTSLGANPNLTENYLYTVEAFDEFYDHLAPDGLLSVSFPAVEGLGLKLVATATEVLHQHGVTEPDQHLVISYITGFVHVLVKNSPFTRVEVEVLSSHFSRPITSFYFPLYNRIFEDPPRTLITDSQIMALPGSDFQNIYTDFFEADRSGQAEAFLESQTQFTFPSTDDRPFFFVMDKWGHKAPVLQILVVVITMLGLTAIILMIVPLLVQNLRGLKLSGAPLLAGYFLALGVGYILIEVNQIQKLSLLLGHPSLAIVFTLSTLLVSSGLGSISSGFWKRSVPGKVGFTTILISVIIGAEAAIKGSVLDSLISLPLAGRLIVGFILVAGPGFLMGIPFPTGLSLVKQRSSAFVAWAWVINSTGSILATLLGVLLAVLWGFQFVFILASVLYLSAAMAFYLYAQMKVPA
jgi:spermidine synthase